MFTQPPRGCRLWAAGHPLPWSRADSFAQKRVPVDGPGRIGGARMSWSGILGKTAVGLGAVAVPMVFALAGAGQASADPGGICVSGPWGTHPHASMGPDGSTGARTGIVGPQRRNDDGRPNGDLRLRPNRPGPSRTERYLEIDELRPSQETVAVDDPHCLPVARPRSI